MKWAPASARTARAWSIAGIEPLRQRAPSHRHDGRHRKTVIIYGQTEVTSI
jgi:hypothetical protein